MTFTKAELTLTLISELSLSKSEAHSFVTNFFEEIGQTLEAGHHLKLSGIGKFMLRDKKSRPGRNPRTKEEVPVSERRVVTFQASQTLKSKLLAIHNPDPQPRCSLVTLASQSKPSKSILSELQTAELKEHVEA